MSETGPKKSVRPPAEQAAAESFAQDLLSKVAQDFNQSTQAAQRARMDAQNAALLGQLQHDFGGKKQAAAELANQLLSKVSRDFGSIPPPASVTAETDAQLEAAGATSSGLTPEELADLDAMTAPTGFWGKLFARLGKKKEP